MTDQRENELLTEAADKIGYDRIEWNAAESCYSGFGSTDPTDRSRDESDENGGLFVGGTLEEVCQAAYIECE